MVRVRVRKGKVRKGINASWERTARGGGRGGRERMNEVTSAVLTWGGGDCAKNEKDPLQYKTTDP